MRKELVIGFLVTILFILGILFKFNLTSVQIITDNKSIIEVIKDIIVAYKAELKAHNKTWQNSINIENKINKNDGKN